MDINYLHKLMALELLPPLPLLRRRYGPGRKNHMKGITRRAYDAAHKDGRDPSTISRQTYRADLRRQAKALNAETRSIRKKIAERDRLERQTRREKAGLYRGQPVSDVMAALRRAGRRHRRVLIDDTAGVNARNLTVLA